MKKRNSGIRIIGDKLQIELSTSLKGDSDWRNSALAMFLMRSVDTARDFFETLPEDKEKMDKAVFGEARKETNRVLRIMEKEGKIDKLLGNIKKDIQSLSFE